MLKRLTFVLVLFSISGVRVQAQTVGGPCPTANSTNQTISAASPALICLVPQVYGPGGLVGVPNNGPLGSTDTSSAAFKHSVHFQTAALASFSPLTADIGTQLSQLPITSPASGFTFAFNPSLGVVSEVTQNYGPILTERAQTIGRHKLFVGFSYQFFNFDKVDGIDLGNFGAVFHHEHEACPPNPTITCSNGVPTITNDFISTQNRIDLKVHQFVAVATFGVTSRLDISVAVPVLDVRMDMASDAAIQNVENNDPSIIPACCVHQFSPSPLPGETLFSTITAPSNGFMYHNHALFAHARDSSGLGDVVFRVKFEALQGEKVALAVGLDARIPSGDELNFLGSGTWGIRPFVALSHSGRISPHANLGIQINGNSVLAGDITTNTKAQLPNVVNYDAGVDVGVVRRLSLSADFLGLALQNEKKVLQATPVPDFSGGSHPDIAVSTATINQASLGVGGKFSPFGKLLVTANVLFRLNDAGLHFKPAPLIGLSYTF